MARSRWWLRSGMAAVLLILLMQVVPYGHAQVNPAVSAEPAWNAPTTRALAKRACFDCHSNETVWPAYARIAPASWLVYYDVTAGRQVLNFSEWTRRQDEADEAAEKVRIGEMPPAAYLWLHSAARLSEAERQRLAQGLSATFGQGGERRRGHER